MIAVRCPERMGRYPSGSVVPRSNNKNGLGGIMAGRQCNGVRVGDAACRFTSERNSHSGIMLAMRVRAANSPVSLFLDTRGFSTQIKRKHLAGPALVSSLLPCLSKPSMPERYRRMYPVPGMNDLRHAFTRKSIFLGPVCLSFLTPFRAGRMIGSPA